MTTNSTLLLETISLKDDKPNSSLTNGNNNNNNNNNTSELDMDNSLDAMEAQCQPTRKSGRRVNFAGPPSETEEDSEFSDFSESENGLKEEFMDDDIVVIVDPQRPPQPSKPSPPMARPLHIQPITPVGTESATTSTPTKSKSLSPRRDDKYATTDYMDRSLFSPELSRHSLEVAHRRAKSLEMELQEELAQESLQHAKTTVLGSKMTTLEALEQLRSVMNTSFQTLKSKLTRKDEYDLLSASSPSSLGSGTSRVEDFDDHDGDGLQVSPDASGSRQGQHFSQSSHGSGLRPALKRISAYAGLDKVQLSRDASSTNGKIQRSPRKVQWDAEVPVPPADSDEEDSDEDDVGYGDDIQTNETDSLVNHDGNPTSSTEMGANANANSSSPSNSKQATRRTRAKRKKLPKSGTIRRLSAKEKEELYKLRPDLMIVPNWAQKYRDELSGADAGLWSIWLIVIIIALGVLLIILVVLLAQAKAQNPE